MRSLLYILIIKITLAISKIQFAFELFRHGYVSPLLLDKSGKDVNGIQWISESELTPSGWRQQYILGQLLRRKYIEENSLISPIPNSVDIYVISTPFDRTIMSAYSQLTGLFPPDKNNLITHDQVERAVPPNNIKSVEGIINDLGLFSLRNGSYVVPIHNFQKSEYFFNLQNPNFCKGVKGTQETINLKNVTDFIDKFNKKYPQVKQFTSADLNTEKGFYSFANAFISEYNEGIDLSKFGNTDGILNECLDFLNIYLYTANFGDIGDFIAINSMSPLFSKLLNYMENAINSLKENKSNPDPKLVIYSGHEANIAAMIIYLENALNLKIQKNLLPFAANFLFDFIEDLNITDYSNPEKFSVEIIYNGESVYKGNYETFKSNINKIMIDSKRTQKFCNFDEFIQVEYEDKPYIITVIILSIIIVVLIISIVVTIVRKKKIEAQEF